MKKQLILFLAAIFTLITPFSSFATSGDFPELNWIEGPTTITLDEKFAQLELSDDFVFINKSDTKVFNDWAGNPTNGTELGTLFPKNNEDDWHIVFEYDKVGYVLDYKGEKIEPEAILNSYMSGNDEINDALIGKGFSPIFISGFVQKPYYDEITKRLTWAISVESAGQESINHTTRILTRFGYLSAVLISSPEKYEEAKSTLNDILVGLTINEGFRYEDFNPETDDLSEYNLIELISEGIVTPKIILGALGMIIQKNILLATGFILLILGLLVKIRNKKSPENNSEINNTRNIDSQSNDETPEESDPEVKNDEVIEVGNEKSQEDEIEENKTDEDKK